jgi:hypothetical protein
LAGANETLVTKRTLRAQPAPGGQFAAGGGHTADQAAGGGGALHAVEAEAEEDPIDPEPVKRAMPTASTPTERGRVNCSEATSTSSRFASSGDLSQIAWAGANETLVWRSLARLRYRRQPATWSLSGRRPAGGR